MAKAAGRKGRAARQTDSAPAAPKPQSPALVWLVLNHVLLLPLAGAFAPMLAFRAGLLHGDGLLITALLGLLVVLTHGACWRLAARAGERRLAAASLGLGLLSLAALLLFSTPSPLVAVVHVGKLLI
ncbi:MULTISPECIES: hypothetical protein [unclassified Stappia]|uniref:hypothetical protein n=1 Tax=unclassified Stappia TaxID=2629676 RepID=UPI001643BBE6|nr:MULTISPECIES: hypothetical protein [unclassified Stappia]